MNIVLIGATGAIGSRILDEALRRGHMVTAVTRDPKGNAQVYLVGPGNKAVARAVTATRTVGTNWVVTAGLSPGDKVITEGIGKVKPNQPVKPVPAGSPQRIGAPQGGNRTGKGG